MPDSDTRLPRSPKSPDNLLRLREEALRRLEVEERLAQATVYGGPPPLDDRPNPIRDEPAPVYGGPPPFNGDVSMTRRRSLWALLLAAFAGIVAWIVKRHRDGSSGTVLFGPQATIYGGPPIPSLQPPPSPNVEQPTPQTMAVAIQTHDLHILTAVNGGGVGDPKSAPHGVALTTGATTAGPFETFTLIWVKKPFTFALKTHDGHYVTAVNGGGIGGPESVQSPIHTDVRIYEPSAKFTITILPDNNHATIQTADGKHFLSAVNGGGVGGSNEISVRTDSTTMGQEEVFRVVPAEPPEKTLPAPLYGGPVPGPRP